MNKVIDGGKRGKVLKKKEELGEDTTKFTRDFSFSSKREENNGK